MYETTIAAIATPQGSGGVGIVRLSGPKAVSIVENIFISYQNRKISELAGFSGTLGQIIEGGSVIDEAIVFRYRAPKSYTGEEIVEISGHGGSWVSSKILRLCYDNGALPAEPGEFTKRAFLNGKLDLAQAEAVMDIISAQGDAALSAANQLHEGVLSKEINRIANRILIQAGHLAAWADYPEEEMEEVDNTILLTELQVAKKELDQLIVTYDYGKILKEGVPTAIVGRPNVGKSTLMNTLIGYDRSIVSDIPGTTRDVVSESARLGDIVLHLADTAGLRESDDLIEQIGVERARKQMEEASLVLVLLDNSEELQTTEIALLESLKEKPTIVLVNKSDLVNKLAMDELTKFSDHVILVSAKNNEGISVLEEKVKELLHLDKKENQVIIANERQRQHLLRAVASLQQGIHAIEMQMTLDAVTVCLEECLEELLTLTGKKASEEVVNQVFSNFCVGK